MGKWEQAFGRPIAQTVARIIGGVLLTEVRDEPSLDGAFSSFCFSGSFGMIFSIRSKE